MQKGRKEKSNVSHRLAKVEELFPLHSLICNFIWIILEINFNTLTLLTASIYYKRTYSWSFTHKQTRQSGLRGKKRIRWRDGGRESLLDKVVQPMRADIPLRTDGEGRKMWKRKGDGGERAHISHKRFLMEQNLHNLLKGTDKKNKTTAVNEQQASSVQSWAG